MSRNTIEQHITKNYVTKNDFIKYIQCMNELFDGLTKVINKGTIILNDQVITLSEEDNSFTQNNKVLWGIRDNISFYFQPELIKKITPFEFDIFISQKVNDPISYINLTTSSISMASNKANALTSYIPFQVNNATYEANPTKLSTAIISNKANTLASDLPFQVNNAISEANTTKLPTAISNKDNTLASYIPFQVNDPTSDPNLTTSSISMASNKDNTLTSDTSFQVNNTTKSPTAIVSNKDNTLSPDTPFQVNNPTSEANTAKSPPAIISNNTGKSDDVATQEEITTSDITVCLQ